MGRGIEAQCPNVFRFPCSGGCGDACGRILKQQKQQQQQQLVGGREL
jgi:hypothetical protein